MEAKALGWRSHMAWKRDSSAARTVSDVSGDFGEGCKFSYPYFGSRSEKTVPSRSFEEMGGLSWELEICRLLLAGVPCRAAFFAAFRLVLPLA